MILFAVFNIDCDFSSLSQINAINYFLLLKSSIQPFHYSTETSHIAFQMFTKCKFAHTPINAHPITQAHSKTSLLISQRIYININIYRRQNTAKINVWERAADWRSGRLR